MRDSTETNKINRRHALGLFAGVTGLSITAGLAVIAPKETIARWRGTALGGEASIILTHPDAGHAKHVLEKTIAELQRLEAIFSLYNPASSLSLLNRDGQLVNPPMELTSLLSTARTISVQSDGRFDITVQPLWDHLHGPEEGPTRKEALAVVDQKHIELSAHKIQLGQGQRITLNGIAQGAITDHLVQLLKREGFENVLLNTGEVRSLGHSPDGDPWKVAVADAQGPKIELSNMAIATSAISAPKAHLFNPRTGRTGAFFQTVSVIAPTATLADGLSTALSLTPEVEWLPILRQYKYQKIHVYAKRIDGTVLKI